MANKYLAGFVKCTYTKRLYLIGSEQTTVTFFAGNYNNASIISRKNIRIHCSKQNG